MTSRRKVQVSPRVLRRLINYDPVTGILTWKSRPIWMFSAEASGGRSAQCRSWNTRFSGKPACGCLRPDGYRSGPILGTLYQAHRVGWAIQFGEWPTDQLDHMNGVRDDNRIVNLRAVTDAENRKNHRVGSRNTSGTMGVSWCKQTKKWRATISSSHKVHCLGRYERKVDAITARKAAEIKFDFHPNHGRAA